MRVVSILVASAGPALWAPRLVQRFAAAGFETQTVAGCVTPAALRSAVPAALPPVVFAHGAASLVVDRYLKSFPASAVVFAMPFVPATLARARGRAGLAGALPDPSFEDPAEWVDEPQPVPMFALHSASDDLVTPADVAAFAEHFELDPDEDMCALSAAAGNATHELGSEAMVDEVADATLDWLGLRF